MSDVAKQKYQRNTAAVRRFVGVSFRALAGFTLASLSQVAFAAGGYFVLGYGPLAHQSAGVSTAIGLDGFAGASNPAKLSAVGDRLDVGVLFFMPHRKIERTDSGTPYDFSSTSRNTFFVLPEAGYAKRIDTRWSWGVSIFGNGGLNTEYPDDNGVASSSANPARCGDRPGNFFFGCGELGFDLSQLIIAPTLSWQFNPGHSFGVSPLLGYQRFRAYGLQAFEAVSERPDKVSNQGYEDAFGAGVRLGWFGQILPWLDLGAAYSTRIYMQKFDEYRGLLADHGAFDVPANFSVGAAVKLSKVWTLGVDVQRIFFGGIPALNNGVLNSLQDPQNSPFGSRNGTGFNWDHQTNYRAVIAYTATPLLTVRAGFAYGRRPAEDNSANSVSLNLLAPNPIRNVTAGFTWTLNPNDELNFAYGRYLEGTFEGPSATTGLGVGGKESVTPYVDTVMLSWSRHW